MSRVCEDCRHFWNPSGRQGHCRAFPPVFVRTHTDFPQTTFTFTEPNWTCGMWAGHDQEAAF